MAIVAWAAERLGRTGVEAETYVRDLLNADMAAPGHKAALAKIKAAGFADAYILKR